MRLAITRRWEAADICLSEAKQRGCSANIMASAGPSAEGEESEGREVSGLSGYQSHVGCSVTAAPLHSTLLRSGWLNNCEPAAAASRAPSHVRFTEPTEGALSLSLFFLNRFTRLRVARRQRRETSGPSDLSSGGAAAEAR